MNPKPPHEVLTRRRAEHAAVFATGSLPGHLDLTFSEALVLGLLRQGVKTYLTVLGHGSTEVGEVLRVYEDVGSVKVYGVRSEIEASHAASALRWVTGEKAAVSIDRCALQALAASPCLPRMGLSTGICLATRRPRTKASTCSKSPNISRGCSCSRLPAWAMLTACTPHSP